MEESTAYRWADRLRLPVNETVLSRSVWASMEYKELRSHKSQYADTNALRLINGDKVFWERNTNSLSYTADIEVTSGNSDYINDFLLFDNFDLVNGERCADDGIWIPDKSDKDKRISITLKENTNVNCIYLYDNPSEDDNILDAEVILDNGRSINTGPLAAKGAPTCIKIDEPNVKMVTIILNKVEGDFAGLSEVEIYKDFPRSQFNFIKLMDENENFSYDYITTNIKTDFYVYQRGDAPTFSRDNYCVTCDNEKCNTEIVGDHIEVHCPIGESCIVRVSDKSGKYVDEVFVSNRTNAIAFWQQVEKTIYELSFYRRPYRLINSYVFPVLGGFE